MEEERAYLCWSQGAWCCGEPFVVVVVLATSTSTSLKSTRLQKLSYVKLGPLCAGWILALNNF
jgi:hypothetical protein